MNKLTFGAVFAGLMFTSMVASADEVVVSHHHYVPIVRDGGIYNIQGNVPVVADDGAYYFSAGDRHVVCYEENRPELTLYSFGIAVNNHKKLYCKDE